MNATLAPDAVARIVGNHLYELLIWNATLTAAGGDRRVALDAYRWGLEQEAASELLAVWVGPVASMFEFERLAFG